MKLSILICTIDSRKELFDKLCYKLTKQILDKNLENEVEILYLSDNKELPVGMKRNILLSNATGKFSCFVDDDDDIDKDYIKEIHKVITENPDIDCIGIKGKIISKNLGTKEFIHSIRYKNYSEDKEYYYRPPNHLNPIKKELIQHFTFPMISFGEDTDWALKIADSGVLLKEVFIDKVLYYYNFEFNKSETNRSI
jgi:glycosyltransferase involved in cell wall biosynthesis